MEREDVINKVFPHSLFGYDPVAVDAFLDEVIREFDRKNNTIDVLRLKLTQELGEAQDVNSVLVSAMQREGFLKRAEELVKMYSVQETDAPAETSDEPVTGDETASYEPEEETAGPEAPQTPEESDESDEIEQMII